MRSKTTVPLAPARPTHAERIRSVLASAHSMTVVTDRERTEVTRLTARALAGHVHLHPWRRPSAPRTRRSRWSSPTSPPPRYGTGCGPA